MDELIAGKEVLRENPSQKSKRQGHCSAGQRGGIAMGATVRDRPELIEQVEERHPASTAHSGPLRPISTAAGQRGPDLALAVAVLGFFVVTLDALVVNVALPAMGHDL